MVSLPPSGIASRAFTTRFIRTCSIWLGSPITVPGCSARRSSMVMSARRSRFMIPASSRTVALRSRGWGCSTCFRANARNWRVSVAPRCPASMISSSWCFTSGSATSLSSMFPTPRMTARMLLKSWAMPPDSRPIASSFCSWRTSFSICRRAVRSRTDPISTVGRPCEPNTGVTVTSPKRGPAGKFVSSSHRTVPRVRRASSYLAVARAREGSGRSSWTNFPTTCSRPKPVTSRNAGLTEMKRYPPSGPSSTCELKEHVRHVVVDQREVAFALPQCRSRPVGFGDVLDERAEGRLVPATDGRDGQDHPQLTSVPVQGRHFHPPPDDGAAARLDEPLEPHLMLVAEPRGE